MWALLPGHCSGCSLFAACVWLLVRGFSMSGGSQHSSGMTHCHHQAVPVILRGEAAQEAEGRWLHPEVSGHLCSPQSVGMLLVERSCSVEEASVERASLLGHDLEGIRLRAGFVSGVSVPQKGGDGVVSIPSASLQCVFPGGGRQQELFSCLSQLWLR